MGLDKRKKLNMCKIWLDVAADQSKMVIVSAENNIMRGHPGKGSQIASIKSDTVVT